jgi:hypothetical protein
VVVMKISISWGIRVCSLLKVMSCFGGTCRLSLQWLRINQAINQVQAGSKQTSVDFRWATSVGCCIPERRNFHCTVSFAILFQNNL